MGEGGGEVGGAFSNNRSPLPCDTVASGHVRLLVAPGATQRAEAALNHAGADAGNAAGGIRGYGGCWHCCCCDCCCRTTDVAAAAGGFAQRNDGVGGAAARCRNTNDGDDGDDDSSGCCCREPHANRTTTTTTMRIAMRLLQQRQRATLQMECFCFGWGYYDDCGGGGCCGSGGAGVGGVVGTAARLQAVVVDDDGGAAAAADGVVVVVAAPLVVRCSAPVSSPANRSRRRRLAIGTTTGRLPDFVGGRLLLDKLLATTKWMRELREATRVFCSIGDVLCGLGRIDY